MLVRADTLTVVDHDDTRTEYREVTYRLYGNRALRGVIVHTPAGVYRHDDVLHCTATRAHAPN